MQSASGGRVHPGDGRAGGKSAGQLMKEVTEDLSNLFRKEVELAKQELSDSVAEKAKGAVVIVIAAVFGFFALIFLLLAVRDGIDSFWPAWAADLLTALLLLVLGGLAATIARKKLSTPIQADLTKKTIKEDVELAKTLTRR